MPVLDRSGVHLAYREAGTGSPPMVFIHGWTCDHSFFAPQFQHFQKAHRVVAPDLRGHGGSDATGGDYPMGLLADDVAWLCGELGVADAVVVGHSMGGAVGVELVVRHPGLASALVLVDSAVGEATAEVRTLLATVAEQLRGPAAAETRLAAIDTLFLPSDDPAVKARVVADMMRVPGHVAAACMEGLAEWDATSRWSELTIPILNIAAERPTGEWSPPESPGPHLVNVQTRGVGHFNQLLAPDEVNRLIEGFLG
jgi:pimeloyl-ACP methyl ester carboxylesterase